METKIKTAATAAVCIKPNALGTFFDASVIVILLNGLTIQKLPY